MNRAFLFHLVIAFCAARLSACPAGYESPESLVRHARLIVEVEVLSVSEAPLPPGLPARLTNEEYGRKQAQARVRVLQVIKGECPVRELTVLGGPYHTCAPYLLYHGFAVGEKRMLILETPLSPDVKGVAITWANRWLKASADHIRELMEKARSGWKQAVERHEKAAPEEMAQARLMHADFIKQPAEFKEPKGTSFAVLSCLAVLSNDPDHLPAKKYSKDDAPERLNGFVSFYESQGWHVSSGASRPVVPAGLDVFQPKPVNFNFTTPVEVGQFNERILKVILQYELFVPPDLSASILKNPRMKSMWDSPQRDSFWPDVRRPLKDSETREGMAFHYLMLLADPEPDALVWGAFGLTAGKNAVYLPPELFVGFLEHNPGRIFEQRGALALLLLLPHEKIAPIVRAHAAKGFYDNWSYELLRYFVRLGSEPDVLNAVEGMEKNADEFIKSLAEPGRDTSMDKYNRDRYLEKANGAVTELGSSKQFKVAKQRLYALAARIKTVEVKD